MILRDRSVAATVSACDLISITQYVGARDALVEGEFIPPHRNPKTSPEYQPLVMGLCCHLPRPQADLESRDRLRKALKFESIQRKGAVIRQDLLFLKNNMFASASFCKFSS